jgi:alanine racemase
MELTFYPDTKSWIECFNQSDYKDEIILLKGARKFSMERLTQKLAGRQHNTVLEINLSNMAHNLNVYKELLQPNVKIMVMVKAFGYGSGAAEIAHTLVFNRIDYLAVAYIDEGIELRKHGIHIPIMVMNPDPMLASELMSLKLEPTLFSLEELKNLKRNGFKGRVHIKLDTGMNRLGFKKEQIEDLLSELSGSPEIEVGSVFSHLSSADLPEQDAFSRQQIQNFGAWSDYIIRQLGYPVLKHLLNSPGIARFPDAQFDMVRLGIGLYGDDPSSELKKKLVPVSSLITTVAQVKEVKAGESISYGRTFIAEKDMKVAVLNIGYADGFRRSLSNGKGRVAIDGMIVPVVGRICMDMCIVDVSDLEGIYAGDKAEIFGEKIGLRTLAKQLDTIPYEVLTGISQRVRRVYTEE